MTRKINSILIGFESTFSMRFKPSDFEMFNIYEPRMSYEIDPSTGELYENWSAKGIMFVLKKSANVLEKWYDSVSEDILPFDRMRKYSDITDVALIDNDGIVQLIGVPYIIKEYGNEYDDNPLQRAGILNSENLLVEIRSNKKEHSIFKDKNWKDY